MAGSRSVPRAVAGRDATTDLPASPGTGKTYVARKPAEWIAKSADRVRLVQIHPTYSYEDFVDGYRPRQDGSGFDLTKGPLLRIAEEAAAHPDNQYVLVIDELNRANVAQVFGELPPNSTNRRRGGSSRVRDEPQLDLDLQVAHALQVDDPAEVGHLDSRREPVSVLWRRSRSQKL
ncbi:MULTISPECIES: AAA family ATPase [unclassified Amycolatopsis]|uniref:AAA family ATPase n=1 Tax=unclassified Amycolatopsis TaxID=2618356 RepID=UPI0028752C8F|nr:MULTISPECIES: AAA family ATPase [unclassified Amycolatopsis]MDS0135871.1 AAA family ATPase [Amycolatopsis sp. 505]MDS0145540.1 AAA family ATPase [Amycolatopsis sp. CM201R]